MAIPTPLPPESLYRQCDPNKFSFQNTSEIDGPTEVIGQDRAIEAIQFGIGIRHDGFNLFALGPNGTGKHTAISQYLHQKAPNAPKPDDWCYVYNFDQPHQPRALQLQAGHATVLRNDMNRLVEELFTVIPAAFSSDEYQAQNKTIKEELLEKQSQALEDLKKKAEERHITLIRTPSGFALAPMKEGEVIKPSEFMSMNPELRESIEKEIATLHEALQAIMEQVPEWQRETQNKIKALNQEVASFAVKPLMAELRKKHGESKSILTYLDVVESDIIENFDQFIEKEESPFAQAMGLASAESGRKKPYAIRYQVNVIIDNCETCGAPVIYEDKPAYANLIGRIEHISQMGTLLTDFTLIKPGALHRANGGYLIIDALRILSEPYAYEGLKQAIRSKQIRIESLGQAYSLISTVSLEPEPIPLNVKVVLLGERTLYYLLCEHDPDFCELFKVAADFEDDITRDETNHLAYARLISDVARKENLRHFDRAAVARVIEHCSRLAGDATKLSTHMQSISDLVREADYRAAEKDHATVTADDVQRALDAKLRRASRIQERMQDAILRQTILIDTDGEKAGQINGLAIYTIGNHSFGRPSRITARARMG
ncbi:MAG: AAA family ATPase, partial [Chlorobiales bacterium]|nr:AAA family ATPase [Chlorobiales bacterium]